MNLPTGSATPPKTRIEIDPERSLPLVAISATGTDWPIAAPEAQRVIGTAIAANKIRAMRDDRRSESLRAILKYVWIIRRATPNRDQISPYLYRARYLIEWLAQSAFGCVLMSPRPGSQRSSFALRYPKKQEARKHRLRASSIYQ